MKKLFVSLFGVLMVLSSVNCQKKTPEGPSHSLRSVYYDYDQSFLRTDATQALNGNAGYLKAASGASVTIEGHCDERGTNEYNLALGQRRADSARNYLVNMGISPARVRTVSYGEEKPVCYQHNESCWWKNRRADFRRR